MDGRIGGQLGGLLLGGDQDARRHFEQGGDQIGRRLAHARTQQPRELQIAGRTARAEDAVEGGDVIAANNPVMRTPTTAARSIGRGVVERTHSLRHSSGGRVGGRSGTRPDLAHLCAVHSIKAIECVPPNTDRNNPMEDNSPGQPQRLDLRQLLVRAVQRHALSEEVLRAVQVVHARPLAVVRLQPAEALPVGGPVGGRRRA